MQQLKAAMYVQICAHFQLPEGKFSHIETLAQSGETRRIQYYLQNETIAERNPEAVQRQCNKALRAMRELEQGVEPDDFSSLLANFESITGRAFVPPASVSAFFQKIEG
ncbi:MAG TPA: hypothetical protein VGP72_30375 [Planctomycetota bacterium]|jgi:hypothetical protein